MESLIKKLGSVEMVAARVGTSSVSVRRWRAGVFNPTRLAQARIVAVEKEVTHEG